MSVFTSRHTKTLDVPGAPGQTVTVRKLAPKHLEAAGKASQHKAMADMEAMGGPAKLRELQALGGEKSAEAKPEPMVNPALLFDRVTVIEKGVTAWSFEESLTRESIEDLDDETGEWLATEILRYAKPGLFQTDAAREADRKNG